MMKKEKNSKETYARWFGIRLAMVLFDLFAVNFSYYIALLIRYYINHELFDRANLYFEAMWQFAPYYTICCLVVFLCFKLYNGMWKYAGLNDMNRILLANVVTAAIQVAGTMLFVRQMSLTYYVLGALIQFMLIALSRFSYRIFAAEITKLARKKNHVAINVMIVGVGEIGSIVRRKIENDHNNAARPVCLFTAHNNENSRMMDGLPIVSGMDRLKDSLQKYHVDNVILADSQLTASDRNQIQSICSENEIGVQDFSGYFQNSEGTLTLKKLMEYIGGPVDLVIEGKKQSFANGKQVQMPTTGQYEIQSISAHDNRVVVELRKHQVILNNVNESWVQEFEQETGEPVSFF